MGCRHAVLAFDACDARALIGCLVVGCLIGCLVGCRDDLEQVRILADQCRRREKLRKRGLATWNQDMQGLLQQAIALDQELLGPPASDSPSKGPHAGKLTAGPGSKRQTGSKGSHSKAAHSKQVLQLAAEIADATENAQAKFEHDMALSLQLTNSVADEAAKLHHVKIVRAESSHSEADADAAGPSSEAAQEAAQVFLLLQCLVGLVKCCLQTVMQHIGLFALHNRSA